MYVKKFVAVRFPSKVGPDLFGLATLIRTGEIAGMKNGRGIVKQDFAIRHEFNPNGLVTKEEFDSFYSDESIKKDDSHVALNKISHNKEDRIFKRNRTPYSPKELITEIRAALEIPIDIETICNNGKILAFRTNSNRWTRELKVRPSYDFPEYWNKIQTNDGLIFEEIVVVGHFPSEEQRALAEKTFYVIKVMSEFPTIKYLQGLGNNHLELTYNKSYAKQFLKPKTVASYIEKHVDIFDKYKYAVVKVDGISMDDGFTDY